MPSLPQFSLTKTAKAQPDFLRPTCKMVVPWRVIPDYRDRTASEGDRMKFRRLLVLAFAATWATLALSLDLHLAPNPLAGQTLAEGPAAQASEQDPSASPAGSQGADPSGDIRSGPTDPAELEAWVDGIMGELLKEFNTAGAVVSVVSGGDVFFAKGYGYSDFEARTPVDPETTLFRIGSVSKLFVWTSVMQMVERGLLDLNTDVNEYLDFRIPDTYEEPVTLANIMGHAGGFEDYIVELFGDEPEDVRPLGDLLKEQIPARVRPNGDISSYSNHATGMAAYMVAGASGMDWTDYMEENILQPLGMERTTFRQPLPAELEPLMAKGYTKQGPRFVEEDFEYVPLAPVGAASASAADMARFMMAHLQLGQYGGNRILSEETARVMQTDHHRMEDGINGMAHGFMVFDQNGERIIGHGGDTKLFHTGLWLFPDHDLGLYVSFNSSSAGGARGRLFSAFMDRYFPVEEEIPAVEEAFVERAGRFTGEFRANRFSHTTVGKLAAVQTTSVGATSRGTLRALGSEWAEVGPLTFREMYGSRTMIFREDDAGRITHFLISSTPIMAWERPPTKEAPGVYLPIFILAVLTILITLLSPFLGWAIRKWHRIPKESLNRIPGAARLVLWLAAFLFVAGFGLAAGSLVTGKIATEVPGSLGFALFLPLLASLLTVGALFFSLRIWLKSQGRLTVRVLYSVASISLCLFVWQLSVWNLLGWHY